MIERLARMRVGLSGTDQFVLVVAALSPVAWAPVFLFHGAPRVALALALLPLGVLSLVSLARQRDAASIVALALSGTAIVSSCVSPAPLNSLMGSLDWWTGTVGLVTALGWWALGRHLGRRARSVLIPALVVGALWNALIALAQIMLEIDTGTLAAFPGRGSGTMLNPVYYGAFMSGVLACWLLISSGSRRSALVVLALSFGLGLSGGRVAVGSALVVAAASLVIRSERRIAIRNTALTLIGVFFATLVVASNSPGRTVTARVASGQDGGGRVALWRVTLDALRQRPVLGWGPGNTEIATERQFDLEYTKAQLTSDGSLTRWIDTHNLLLNVIVWLGAIGGVLVLAFVALSIRSFLGARDDRVSRALLAGAFAMAVNWMLQPSSIHTVPIAMLLLGASMQPSIRLDKASEPDVDDAPELGAVRTADQRAMSVGVLVGVMLLCNLFVIDRAIRYEHLDVANTVARYGYSDPFVDDLLAEEHRLAILDRDRDEMLDRAAWFATREFARYPVHHASGVVGELEFSQGNLDAALEAELRALQLQPWNPQTHRRLLVLSKAVGDDQLYDASMRALCLLGADACDESGDDERSVTADG